MLVHQTGHDFLSEFGCTRYNNTERSECNSIPSHSVISLAFALRQPLRPSLIFTEDFSFNIKKTANVYKKINKS